MNEAVHDVYIQTAPNGKHYIGITRIGIKERWRSHIKSAKRSVSDMQVHQAMREQGFNWTGRVLETQIGKINALKAETKWIMYYQSHLSENGYNKILYGKYDLPPFMYLSIFKDVSKEMFENDFNQLKDTAKIAAKYNQSVYTIKQIFDYYSLERKKYVHYSCDDEFFSRDTEESFYIAGYLSVKGNLRTSGYWNQIRILAVDEDLEFLEKINNIFKSNRPLNIEQCEPNEWVSRKYTRYLLRINSEQMCKDLERFNIKSDKKYHFEIPNWIISHKYFHHFLRGTSDGSGSFYVNNSNKPQVHFNVQGTKQMIEVFQSTLEKNCSIIKSGRKITCTKHNEKEKRRYSFSYGGNRVAASIANFLYKDATIYMQRKYEIAMLAKSYSKDGLPQILDFKRITKELLLKTCREGCRSKRQLADKLNYTTGNICILIDKFDIYEEIEKIFRTNLPSKQEILELATKCKTVAEIAKYLQWNNSYLGKLMKEYNCKEEVRQLLGK